ncbi:hypothetical protein PR048_002877 [Dryococelus australis]|uniref:Uncharacterized protein n=1 Tax=Dryococelus australis TaxID=614101 RepID=A0ABQ9ILE3_9NEOP|nr:hypothetical protein PR048_002877 [Dryococelus australis]
MTEIAFSLAQTFSDIAAYECFLRVVKRAEPIAMDVTVCNSGRVVGIVGCSTPETLRFAAVQWRLPSMTPAHVADVTRTGHRSRDLTDAPPRQAVAAPFFQHFAIGPDPSVVVTRNSKAMLTRNCKNHFHQTARTPPPRRFLSSSSANAFLIEANPGTANGKLGGPPFWKLFFQSGSGRGQCSISHGPRDISPLARHVTSLIRNTVRRKNSSRSLTREGKGTKLSPSPKEREPRWCGGQTTRLPPRRTGFYSWRGHSRIFASGNRWVSGISWGSPAPPPHSGPAPYSTRFTLIGSQDLDVKSSPNLFTYSLFVCRTPMSVMKMTMEQRRNERVGETEIPEKTRRPTASSGTIPTCENPVTRPGVKPCSPWWEASKLIAQPPRPPRRK